MLATVITGIYLLNEYFEWQGQRIATVLRLNERRTKWRQLQEHIIEENMNTSSS